MNDPQTIQEAEREKEVRDALTLSEKEKQIMKAQVEWKLQGIEVVVQRALYEKIAPLLLRIWKELDRQEAMLDRLKREIRRK